VSPHLDSEGIWREVLRRPATAKPRPALFLDRDGTINVEIGYLHEPAKAVLVPGAAAAIAAANRADWLVVVITNQGGVGRGYYGWEAFRDTQRRIEAMLADDAGAKVDMVLACPFHPEAPEPALRHKDHYARKPHPGMLFKAAADLPIDLARSIVAGDRASDLMAGRAAGCEQGVLVDSGFQAAERKAAEALAREGYRVRVAPDLSALTPGFGAAK